MVESRPSSPQALAHCAVSMAGQCEPGMVAAIAITPTLLWRRSSGRRPDMTGLGEAPVCFN